MFSNKFGTFDNVECGLVQLMENVQIGKRSTANFLKTVPIPLQSVSVAASLIHAVGQVELTQVYVNKEEQPIEAIYYFPVDSNGSVTHFHAELEGRTITGVVKPEEEAKEQYKKAMKRKQTAFLMESNKPDIFKVQIGFLKPGSQVKIVIGWVTEIKNEKESNAIRFFIPTTVAPRYISPAETDEKSKDLRKMTFSESTPAPLSLVVNLAIQGKIKSIDSPTHKIKSEVQSSVPENENWHRSLVTLEGNVTDMDRDFILLITPEEVHVPRLYSEKFNKSIALMTHLIPSFNLDEQKVELIFVLDRSGSMCGTSIKLAKKALLLFLHSLPSDCYFNIVGFGSTFEFLYPESVKYDEDSLKKAISHAKNLDADLGGTEILRPLKAIFAKKHVQGYLRQIFILTDGEVSDTDRLIGICQANAHNARIFALGIGDGASHALVEGIATAGGGTASFVSNNEPIDAKVLQQLKNAIQPSLTDVSLKWTGIPEAVAAPPVKINKEKTLLGYGKPISSPSVAAVSDGSKKSKPYWQVPVKIPPILDGAQLVVFGVFPEDKIPSGVEITAESPDGPLSIQIPLLEENYIGSTGMIHKLAAIKAIREMEIKIAGLSMSRDNYSGSDSNSDEEMEISHKHNNDNDFKILKESIINIAGENGLASKYTSFVAVDESCAEVKVEGAESRDDCDGKDNWIMQTRYVPSQFANGWHGGISRSGSKKKEESCDSEDDDCLEDEDYDDFDLQEEGAGVKVEGKKFKRVESISDDDCDEAECEDTMVEDCATAPALRDSMIELISTQSFDGSFPMTPEFSTAIGIPLDVIMHGAKAGGYSEQAWATALALTYLECKLNNEKESWELVALKGKKWLQANFESKVQIILDAACCFLK